MRMSDKGMIALIRREALVLKAYKDSVGIWTIGVGHTAAAGAPRPTSGMVLAVEAAVALFRSDLAKYESDVRRAVKVPVAQHEFDALVSFHYNTGAIARAAVTRKLNAGDKAGAAAAFMSWVKPVEITGRRNEERVQFLTGAYGDVSRIPVYDEYPRKRRYVTAAAVLGMAPPAAPRFADLPADDGEPDATDTPTDLTPDEIKANKRLLRAKGYSMVGEPDEDMGPRTRAAITAFQTVNELPITATFDPATRAALADPESLSMPVAEARANATTAEIAEKVPEVASARRTGLLAKLQNYWIGTVAAIYGVKDYLAQVWTDLVPLREALDSIPWWVFAGIAVVFAFGLWWSNADTAEKSTEAYRRGDRT